jgi:hypothetical protein
MFRNLFMGALLAAVVLVAGEARADVINLDATITAANTGGNGWMAIAPAGAGNNNCYPCSDPIDGPGADPNIATFEAANPGWNSNPNYVTTGWSAYGGTVGSPQQWIDNLGTNPFFGRDVIDIPGTPTAGSFTMGVDDDSLVWVNGTLVPGLVDHNGNTNSPSTADITPYLVDGQNVIAFLADNSAGGGFSVFAANGSITYTPDASTPEPASMILFGSGLIGLAGLRKWLVNEARLVKQALRFESVTSELVCQWRRR